MLIDFDYVKWRNFLSTGNYWTEISLNKNPSTLIVGENGSGKSTFLDAITFCLFGKSFRNINKPQLVNTVTRKDCVTEIGFTIGDVKYKIVRGIKPAIFEVYQNGRLLKQNSAMGDYQDILEKTILKINYKSFCQVVILGSAAFVSFMKLPAAQRRAVIEDLLDLQIFSTMNVILKQKILQNNELIVTIENQRKIIEEKIKLNNKHLSDIKLHNTLYIKDHLDNIKNTEDEIVDFKFQIDAKNNTLLELKNNLEDGQKILRISNKLDALIHQMYAQIDQISKDVQFFHDHDNCPTCQQEIDKKFKITIMEEKEAVKEIKTANLDEMKKEYDETKLKLKIINEMTSDIQEKEFEIHKLETKIENLVSYIEQQRDDIKKIKNNDKIVDNSNFMALDSELKENENQLRQAIENKQVFYATSLLLKDSGIKSTIIKQYVPIMNQLINKYLAAMDFYVQMELNEEFEEKIKSRFRDEFSYECLPYSSEIQTEDGLKSIKWIVDNNYRKKVLSLDNNGNFVWNKVINAWSNKNKGKKWVSVKIDGNCQGTKKHLICTEDHKLQVVNDCLNPVLEYSEARNSVNKWSIRLPRYRDNASFNNEQISVILGTMMGDGSINKEGQMRISHKLEHKEYIELKQMILGGKIIDREHFSFGKKHWLSILDISVNGQLKHIHELLYKDQNGNKINKSPVKILPLLDEKSLAFWYMDDGCLNWSKKQQLNNWRPQVNLCTDGFTYEDHIEIKKWFSDKWNINVNIIKYKKYYRINFNCDETEKFLHLVAPYIIKIMEHKLPEKYRFNEEYIYNNNKLDFALSKIHSLKELIYDKNISSTRKYSSRLYDMEIENSHNFIANGTVVHNSFSEGEKMKIDLAILFAWRAIARMRNSCNTKLLILDEIMDSSLDANGTEEFMKIISSLTTDNNTFIISHKTANISDKFSNILEFKKKNNFSRLTEYN